MKVFTLTFVVLLLIATARAGEQRRGEKRATSDDDRKEPERADAAGAELTEADTDKKEKEVHKRGILHYGGPLASSAGLWSKNYASPYGYGLRLPPASGLSVHPFAASHLHAPSVLKYNTGFHYKALAAPSLVSGVSGLGAALPTYASVSPAVGHAHHQTAAANHPYVIRPGGAVVQSYSVTYPHRKPALAVKPVHAFASVAPVQPVHAFTGVQHTQTVQPLQPVAAVQPVQPVAAVQPVHHFHAVQPVQHLHPAPPLQTVLQVQHFKPPVHYDVTQQFPSFFQTSFVPPAPAPAIPQVPTVAFSPAQPAFPAIPTFPNPPDFPTIPSVPVVPNQPPIPDVPAVPAVPAIPNIPTIPSIPNFPQPQVPVNGFFPVSVQPPLNQKPPPFGSVGPQGQFPGFGPIAGHNPDTGSADAAPQIPLQPSPIPEPELPEPTQQPWRPVTVTFEPPTAESPVGRPANTLLPPYGSSPAPGYLPPSTSSHGGSRAQQEYSIDTSLFDHLSDAEIQQIFSQASLAAQHDHHHSHTVHNYHTHY